jgi:hypothetical protein
MQGKKQLLEKWLKEDKVKIWILFDFSLNSFLLISLNVVNN